MAKKNKLYLDDLYNMYSSKYKKSVHFSSEKSGAPIVVQVQGKINFGERDKNKDGLYPVHLQACHIGKNINGSNINLEVMKENLDSFKNRPILGYIHKVVTDDNPEGEWNFYTHNMHEDENDELVYDERPVGTIPESNNAQIVYDEEKEKHYVEVDGYLYEEYSKAVEILEREKECSVSVELAIRELSYNAKEKYLNIEDFFFEGVTILGVTPEGDEVMPGMQGSNIKISDFSEKNNSFFFDYEKKMIELQDRLEKIEAACFNKGQDDATQKTEEGGNEVTMSKFEELLEKYGKTADDITFEYSELSDEELENKFAELFDENGEADNTETDPSEGNEEAPDNAEENEEPETNESSENFEKLVRTYEISHSDIRYALYKLIEPFENEDNTYYWITDVYDSHFVYENWSGDTIFGQKYTKNDDIVALDGERYSLHKELLTDKEYEELIDMRSNYASIVEKYNEITKTIERNEKRDIFNDEAYADYLETDEFKELMSEEIMDKYSKEELAEKADATLGKLVKKNKKFSFSHQNNKTPSRISFGITNTDEKKKAYSTLFD